MGFIKQLDIITANSIAAGEVVERPASVVKELCENAIDAGASFISIDINQGGIRSIQVTDNGCGMDSEDALAAFEAHATSKLRHISDLESLSSMGFRGEALPSIASVSQVTLKTRQVGAPSGTMVKISSGVLEEHVPVGTAEGTSVLIENLFFNVPARHKFLKKDATEAAKVADVVNRLVLARPDISFLLRRDGKVILHSPGNSDLAAAVYTVFGREVQQASFFIQQPDQSNPVKVSGMIGRPTVARRSRMGQVIFVNGRSVQSPMLNKAIDEAYRSLLMKGEFAFAVLKVEVPQSLVDVNVHPQKLEVRFWNEAQVFSAVLHALRDSLYNNLEIKSESVQSEIEEREKLSIGKTEAKTDILPLTQAEKSTPVTDIRSSMKDFSERGEITDREEELRQVSEVAEVRETPDVSSKQNISFENKQLVLADDSDNYQQTEVNSDMKHPDLLPLLKAKISGVLFTTYIILEHDDEYTVIDQHAAHEKILFERLIEQARTNQSAHSQILLTPEIMRMSQAEMVILESEKDFFEALGFQYDTFGEQRIALRSVPASAVGKHAGETLHAALDEIIANDSNLGLKADRDDVYLAIATAACKAAIKAHDVISTPEIQSLIQDLLTLENPYQCPHGRPVFVRSTRKELEKRFRRIV